MRKKRIAAAENFAAEGPRVLNQVFCLIRFRGHGSQPAFVEAAWQKFDGNNWIDIFRRHVGQVQTSRADA